MERVHLACMFFHSISNLSLILVLVSISASIQNWIHLYLTKNGMVIWNHNPDFPISKIKYNISLYEIVVHELPNIITGAKNHVCVFAEMSIFYTMNTLLNKKGQVVKYPRGRYHDYENSGTRARLKWNHFSCPIGIFHLDTQLQNLRVSSRAARMGK